MKAFIVSITAGLLFSPTVTVAELYKWTDDQGHLHITDAPPSVTYKKSAQIVVPAPQSPLPKKTRVAPEQPRAEALPIQVPRVTSPASEEPPVPLTIEGLNPFRALLTSPWQVLDNTERDARAPVQSWKDKQGLDHFVDVLPVAKSGPEAGTKIEDPTSLHPTRKGKEQPAGVGRSHHHATE